MTSALLGELVAPFGLSAHGLERLAGGQNFVYRHDDGERRLIVRIGTGRHRTAAQVAAELAWLERLAGAGLRVCVPMPTLDGRLLHEANIGQGIYVVAVFNHAPGVPARRGTAGEADFEKIGRLTGMMHREAKQAAHEGAEFARPRWDESRLLREDFDTCGKAISTGFRTGVDWLIADLKRYPATPATYGLVHADINFANLYDDRGGLTIFDFDNCEYGYFAQDLATILYDSIYCKVLNQFADEGLTRRMKPLWRALLQGYGATGPAREIDPIQLKKHFLLREAIIYVHYHRTLDIGAMGESFHRGLAVIRDNIETNEHQVNFAELLV